MSTDQRRFQVFVSSTYLDLREARQQVTMTLLESDAFPTGMEIFPAADDDVWTLIKRVIDESDYYLLISAGKYGSIDAASGLSYTEMEYDYAVSANKPVMAFLHRNLGDLKSDQCEKTDDQRQRLENFREKVRKAKHVKFWESADELAGQVALAYNKFIRQYPAIGWVRADNATSAESLKDLLDAKSRIAQLEDALNRAETSAPAGTEDLAQGSDEYSLTYFVIGTYSVLPGFTEQVTGSTEQRPTWDALFGAVAPLLLQEAEEKTLRESISSFLVEEFFDENVAAVDRAFKAAKLSKKGITTDDLSVMRVKIDNSDFGTILVQLTALGLIQRSERKRSVNDSGTYWTLTRYGETRTVHLRAIKKGGTDKGATAPRTAT